MELKNLSFNQIQKNKKLIKKIIEETNYLPENINLSQRIYHIKNNLKKIPKCPICGNDLNYISLTKGYTKTCSKKCGAKFSQNKREQTNLKKYGIKTLLKNTNKIKSSLIKKYGVENIMKLDEIKEKIKITKKQKYGTHYELINKKIKEKMKDGIKKRKINNLKKYGVEHTSQLNEFKNKVKFTNLKKYYFNLFNRLNDIVEPLFDLEEYKQNGKSLKYKFRCKKCGNVFEDTLANGKIPICRKCFPIGSNTSHYEDELENWLKKYKIKIIRNKKFDNKYELDLYLPKYNFGIEFNGLYWHSTLFKNKNYHKNKTEYFFKKNIRVFHIFEDEWMFKQNIIKSMILAKLGIFDKKIYARNCKIKEIDFKVTQVFLEQNHLDGYINSKYNLGLFYNNKLVMVATFGRHRFKKDEKLELYRIATKLNHQVIGGFSKLINYYKDYKIITYIDRRFGGIYNAKTTNPNLWYTDTKQKYNRMKFQKHKLKKILKKYNPNLTANQNLELNGIYPIYGVGNYILEF